jgi:hypothetical protein
MMAQPVSSAIQASREVRTAAAESEGPCSAPEIQLIVSTAARGSRQLAMGPIIEVVIWKLGELPDWGLEVSPLVKLVPTLERARTIYRNLQWANLVLAVLAPLLLAFLLELRFELSGAPLVRTKDQTPGEEKDLIVTAEVPADLDPRITS